MIIMSSQHVMKGEEVQKWIQLDASLQSLLKKKHCEYMYQSAKYYV